MSGEVEETHSAKLEIIKYYNKTKGSVGTMDKMLGEYTLKQQSLLWPLAFFYNMIDVTGLACYVIYREHNARSEVWGKGSTKKVLERASHYAVYALN